MPFFDVELNRIADDVGASDLTMWLHTALPTNVDPTIGRTAMGGTGYESGVTLAASDIGDSSTGDISNTAAIAFGTADEDVGTVIYCSAHRGSAAVGYWPLPTTIINSGDSFTIPIGALQMNGSST